ncbi:UNVERIFIED_ORG: hypothetical protein E4P37_09990 [Bacillus sp. AZ43]
MAATNLEAQIRHSFAQLTLWGDRVREAFEPEPGSSLAEDDAVFPWLSTADIAWQGLVAAQDHLKGFRAWWLANDAPDPDARPGLFPIATFSLLRGALVGGAIASWVLTSDHVDVRTGRSLTVAADWYANHLRWAKGMRNYAVDRERHEDQIRHVEGRAAQVAMLRESRKPRGRLKTTDAITQANAEIWTGDEVRAAQTAALWQAGSGDAHALGWSILTRQHDRTPLGDGMGTFVTGPSLLDVANAYFCAYDFVAYGFHRLDELGARTP